MKTLISLRSLLLAAALLVGASCSSKKDDPAASTPAAASPIVYTDASGRSTAIRIFSAYSVTAAPVVIGQARRAVVVRALLPNGSTMDVNYVYVGGAFPATPGAIVLGEAPRVDNYGGALATPTSYQAAGVTQGALNVETVSPQTVTGTYTGPLVVGGGAVKLAFTRISF